MRINYLAGRVIVFLGLWLLSSRHTATANDWTMGDWVPDPRTKVFIVKVAKAQPATGRRKVHTLVGAVEQIIQGDVREQRAGIVLPIERTWKVPAVGSRVLVMSLSDSSPYTPIWMMHGFIPIESSLSKDIVKCAELSAAYIRASTPPERSELLESIAAIEKADPKVYEIAKRLPYESCKRKIGKIEDRNASQKAMRECMVEYGARNL
jgi:hypothetical protein